jgi:hypothetical protein
MAVAFRVGKGTVDIKNDRAQSHDELPPDKKWSVKTS